ISTIFLSLSLSLWRHFWTHSVAPTGRPNGAVLIKGLFVFTKQQRSGPTPGPFPSLLPIHINKATKSTGTHTHTHTHTHKNYSYGEVIAMTIDINKATKSTHTEFSTS